MSQTFCRHPYKYDGSDDSDTDEGVIPVVTDKKDKKERKQKKEKSGELSDTDNRKKEKKERRAKRREEDKAKELSDTEDREKERKERRSKRHEKKSKKKNRKESKEEPVEEEKVEKEPKKYPETDIESDGQDNSCVKMSIHFVTILRNTVEKEDVHALRDTLKKTPIAVVLHYLHYLFHLVRGMPEFTDVMLEYNKKYNVVSRYFLKSLRSDERTEEVMESLKRVTSEITNRVPLDEIDGLLRFTPEMICMCTIQSGNMESHDKITSEWELSNGFMKSRDLIAAFFGIKKYFSDPTRYADRRDLIISCICGGSVKTLSRIVRKTKTEYLTEYTIRKTRAICIPNPEMVKFLHEKYELSFY